MSRSVKEINVKAERRKKAEFHRLLKCWMNELMDGCFDRLRVCVWYKNHRHHRSVQCNCVIIREESASEHANTFPLEVKKCYKRLFLYRRQWISNSFEGAVIDRFYLIEEEEGGRHMHKCLLCNWKFVGASIQLLRLEHSKYFDCYCYTILFNLSLYMFKKEWRQTDSDRYSGYIVNV